MDENDKNILLAYVQKISSSADKDLVKEMGVLCLSKHLPHDVLSASVALLFANLLGNAAAQFDAPRDELNDKCVLYGFYLQTMSQDVYDNRKSGTTPKTILRAPSHE